MENQNQEVLQHLCESNPKFRLLYEEHLLFEKELEQFNQKSFLTPEEELEKKKVQKMKLAGKDEMERIMRSQRQ